jgi:hypothetical protein
MSVLSSHTAVGLALFGMASFCAIPAGAAAKTASPKTAVHSVERNAPDVASSAPVAAVDSVSAMEWGWGRVKDSDWGPAVERPAVTESKDFDDFYYIPEAARVEAEPMDKRNLYWIGATGAVLAAGIAAWFIFSEEPKSQTSAVIAP